MHQLPLMGLMDIMTSTNLKMILSYLPLMYYFILIPITFDSAMGALGSSPTHNRGLLEDMILREGSRERSGVYGKRAAVSQNQGEAKQS